jgi:uncharacterized protein (TIGR03435 family)
MTANERELKHFVDRQLPTPTHMEATAARDRVLDQLRATPAHLQTARIAESAPPVSRWRTGVTLAAAAALIALVATVPFGHTDWIATVEAADGSSYTLKPDTVLSATDAGGLQLTLKDGARVEMRSASKLSLAPAANGVGIQLLAGDIIVSAADQTDRDLSVHTSDMTISVAGTVSLVKTVEDGSRVAAIEGTVRIRERAHETVLRPGEQFSSSPALTVRPIRDDITWSRNAGAHLAILDSFTQGIAQTRGVLTPVSRQVDAPGAPTPTPAAVNAQAAGPEFEEASIRECDPDNLPPSLIGARGGGANSVMMTPGRYYALCVTPATLIRNAYGFRGAEIDALLPGGLPAPRGGRAPLRGRFGVVGSIGQESGLRVRGGPDWVRKEQFTIEAVADAATDTATMSGPMLRALFERRFKLKTHVETEQTLAYNLVVAPGGLKIKPVPAGSCEVPPQVGSPPSTVRRADGTVQVSNTILVNGMPLPIPRPLTELRRAAKPSCAVLEGPNGPNWVILAGEKAFDGLSGLTQFLRAFLGNGLGVTDRTGITDKFNWDLEFLVDANVRVGSTSGIIPVADANVPRAPTLFDALEQQLGLRLEPTKVPREYLVIDSIERPGPN